VTQSTLSLWLKAAGRVSVVRETSPQWIDRVRRQPVWAESRHRDDRIDDPLDLVPNQGDVASMDRSRSTSTGMGRISTSR